MLKKSYARILHSSPGLLTGLLTACVLIGNAPTMSATTNSATLQVRPFDTRVGIGLSITQNATYSRRAEETQSLDNRRLFALGMIETGNDDRAIGLAGEVSRYQLSPSVWKSYSKSENYQNTDLAVQVAKLHWNYLAAYYKEKTGHLPSDFDMYVLWNTRYGYYARNHFSKGELSSVVKERASRFVNLVNRREYASK